MLSSSPIRGKIQTNIRIINHVVSLCWSFTSFPLRFQRHLTQHKGAENLQEKQASCLEHVKTRVTKSRLVIIWNLIK